MEMNDEDISQSSTDILKQETRLTNEKFNLSHSRPLKETLDLLEELSKDPVKKEEDIKRVLDDVLKRLLDVVIPETESTLRQIREKENAREDSFPHRDYFNAWWMLGKIHVNVLEAKEISPDIMIQLNLAMQTSNYLSFLMEAKSDAVLMSSLSMCHRGESLQFRRDCWTLKYHIQPKGEKREIPEKVKGAIQRLFAFPQNIFAHLFMKLEMEVHSRSGEFVQCLEFSKTMLPKLPGTVIEQLKEIKKQNDAILAGHAELKAQGGKIEQGMQEVKDKVEPKKEDGHEQWGPLLNTREITKKMGWASDRVTKLRLKVLKKLLGVSFKMQGSFYYENPTLKTLHEYNDHEALKNPEKTLYRDPDRKKKHSER